jgi:hypothetical protein
MGRTGLLGLAKETVSMVLAQTSSSSREPFVHVEMIEGSKMALSVAISSRHGTTIKERLTISEFSNLRAR